MTVVASTVSTLTEEAEALLAVAETALATTDAGVPGLSYISVDPPAFDCCPALIVTVGRVAEASTSPFTPVEESMVRPKIVGMILVTYTITVLRCAANPGANGSLPSPAAMQTVAAETQQDVLALWSGVTNAFKNGDIFDSCLGFHRDPMNPVREQGGCVGWTWDLRAKINGIPNL